ncbi:cell division protein FtsZ [Candidatus Bipolaricaulota bacterium]|nr:cell division protein FtsZ [Candidatus Bipolaricaulota bacterium]MBS3814236.1 cell division protein FtsZ [Candidatus Bipolaricaulota bacterium]MBS3825376.1 cell division protein FtsZ [Candidatus Bipolaricaulota bacterium]
MEDFYKSGSTEENESSNENQESPETPTSDQPEEIRDYNPEDYDLAKLMVIGIGGGGNNAIDRMVEAGVDGVELVSINTDAQVLDINKSDRSIQIGKELTGGLGAGGDPEIGREAALENKETLEKLLKDVDMLFITCGMGGGTGTGATPVIAEVAQKKEILTTGIVTKPFSFEGQDRAEKAKRGLKNLTGKVDTMITISNDRLLEVAPGNIPLIDAFILVDEILMQGVKGISELITVPGMINLDFADLRNAMKDGGPALMGIGEAEGKGKTKKAAKNAISSPLLEGSINGAKNVIMNVTGNPELTLEEVTEAAQLVKSEADEDANIIFGTTIKDGLDSVKLTVIATGYSDSETTNKREEDIREIALTDKENGNLRDENDLDIPTFLRRG